MKPFLLRRLGATAITLFGVSVLTFALAELAPGDPLAAGRGGEALAPLGPEAAQAYRRALGLDRPLPARYAEWVARVAALDFGRSSYDHRLVRDKLAEALPVTALLAALALALTWTGALAVGVACAARRGSRLDRALCAAMDLLYAVPPYWAAILLLLFLAGGRYLEIFPLQGLRSPDGARLEGAARVADLAWHLALPVLCLSYATLAASSRYVRASLIEALGQDFVRTARAKGLSEAAVLLKHALRNAAIPLITLLGLSVPHLMGGSVLIETIFGLPGMGRLGWQAIATRDTPTLLAVTTVAALLTCAGLLLSDLGYALADPRVRLRGGRS